MEFPEITELEDMDKNVAVSQWDLIAVAEQFQRRGFYAGVCAGLGLVVLFVMIRSVI